MPSQATPSLRLRIGGVRAWEALLAVAALALYARTVGFGWVYDDQLEIVLNTYAHSLRYLPEMFTTTVWTGSGMETYLYRPLALVSYAANYAVSALHPWSYHLVNILLHAAISVLVFRLGRMWGLSELAAGLGSLLFVAHPVHVEVVAAVFGRKDLLAALFILAMVLSHRRARADGGWRSLLPVLAYACAVLSKEVGAVGILLVGAHDWMLESDRHRIVRNRRAGGLYVSYLLVLLLYLLARMAVAGGLGVPDTSYLDNPLVVAAPLARLGTAIVVIGRGLALLIAPLLLSPDYSYDSIPVVASVIDWRLLLTVVALGLLGGALALRGVRRSFIPLALAWYGITLFPTSNLLVTVGTVFGERLLYLPSVAFCLVVGAGLGRVTRRRRTAGAVMAAAFLVAYAAQTVRYSGAWESDIPLFRWAVSSVPNSTKAHHKLGEELLRTGQMGDALRSLNRAMDIAPENEFAAATLGLARRQLGERYLARPGDVRGLEPPPTDPEVLYVLGQLSRERGALPEAERYWEEALAADSTHAESLADMGLLRLTQGDTAKAEALLGRAVRQEPSVASAWYNLARIHLARGERQEAERSLRSFVDTAGKRYPDQVAWARGMLARLQRR